MIFRVGYADHSSWDMAWLRIDWNGHGFDAFVTDANLARTRVSFRMDALPRPDQWLHLAFAWDEDHGVRLFIDGREAARAATGNYDAALDQLGLAGRVMAPYQVQSRYNFLRGSDFQHIRVYDRMLDAPAVATLARGREPASAVAIGDGTRAWRHRFGWEGAAPQRYTGGTRIRKIEFADTRDLKAWMWKATDGIAETTWPGVYNRSRLPGRNDYFQLPDWNTYVEGGQHLDLTLPATETVNRVEIRGAAFGTLSHGPDAGHATDVLVAPARRGAQRRRHCRAARRRAAFQQRRAGNTDPGNLGLPREQGHRAGRHGEADLHHRQPGAARLHQPGRIAPLHRRTFPGR